MQHNAFQRINLVSLQLVFDSLKALSYAILENVIQLNEIQDSFLIITETHPTLRKRTDLMLHIADRLLHYSTEYSVHY